MPPQVSNSHWPTYLPKTSTVRASPDPKNDFLLALCFDHQAAYLLTGNKIDLLNLGQFETTQIITLSQFLQRHLSSEA